MAHRGMLRQDSGVAGQAEALLEESSGKRNWKLKWKLEALYGSFPNQGDPNIDPKEKITPITGTPKTVPKILGKPLNPVKSL